MRHRRTMMTGSWPLPLLHLQSSKACAPHPIALTRPCSVCVAIASSSKFLRQQLSNAMVDFSTPLRIVDHTAPDQDFPELIKFDDVARGHNADGGAGSALLVKGIVAVRALRDFCCNHSKGGETLTLRACAPFVGGVLRRAEAKFHSGVHGALLLNACCAGLCILRYCAGAEHFSVDIRDEVLMPQQVNWLVQAVSANSASFMLNAATVPLTQRFCALLHVGGVEAGTVASSAVRWDTAREVYKVVHDSL